MLGNAKVHPTLPAVDIKRAKDFYTNKLGLEVIKETPEPGIVFLAGEGSFIYMYQRDATKAEHTVASFVVDDVKATVKGLKANGVVFQDVEIPGTTVEDGVLTLGEINAAWFSDTEGNTLGISNL